jgi:4-diphosphocytidyl-2-C-methyl-D-erythritol kinase
MNKIVIQSPAKINIGLNIVHKRDDGFHDLETIFYPINLYDEISFTKSDKFSFESNDEVLNKETTNLIIRAKELLENEVGTPLLVDIFLNKNIPIGAGLGGGSSNAASTLTSLAKLYEIKIDNHHLSKLALKLGSDVPYFLHPVPSFAESRGEVLVPINLSFHKYILIVNPGIHVSTKWAFGLIKTKIPDFSIKSLISKPRIEIEEVMRLASNDFESMVFEHFKEIKRIKEKMLEFGASYSMMTGTGSTVWGMFHDKELANRAKNDFRNKSYFTFLQNPI